MPRRNKKHLRIAMLGHKRIPSREGGVEIVVGELATRMVSMGHEVTCYNRKGHHVSGADFDGNAVGSYNGVRLKNVFTIQKKGLAAMTSSFFASIRTAFSRYDIIHFHAEGPCAMIWLPKLFRKRCIATVHGLDHKRAKWGGFASRYIRFGEKCAVRFADEIIVLSENVQKYFKDTYNRETVFIPNGVSKPEVLGAEEITNRFGIERDEYILYLGRLVPEKGLTYLVEAFKNTKTDKKLVIAGGASDSGGFDTELKALAADDDRIIFTGFVQGRALQELYSNAYIYVLPSDLEGMPLSLLEAMSYGNCCLVSSIPECTEVVEDYGVIFEKGNVEELCEKIQMLCDSPETVGLYKRKASDYICSKYNWNDVTAETLKLYGVDTEKLNQADEDNKQLESIV